jgi:hypothetical protein
VNTSKQESRRVLFAEIGLATTTGLLALVTLLSREWIELVLRVDPDHGNGVVEWLIVVGLALATLLFGALARNEWRRLRAPQVPSTSTF